MKTTQIPKRVLWWLLIVYALCVTFVAIVAVAMLETSITQKLTRIIEVRKYNRQTAAAKAQIAFDSGVIGPIGETAQFDWSAWKTIPDGQSVLLEALRQALGPTLDYEPETAFAMRHEERLENGMVRYIGTVNAERGWQIKVCVLRRPRDEKQPTVLIAYGLGGSLLQTCGYRTETYHHDVGMGIAEAGYLAVTYELRALGPDAGDWGEPNWGNMAYDDFVGYTLLRGSCPMNVWVHDTLQVVRAMQQESMVDPSRIGVAGVSHGGQIAMYAAALSPDDIRVAINMGGFLSFEDLYTRIHNLTGHVIPGITRIADMGDLAGLVAPRPLLIQWGEFERDRRHRPLRDRSIAEFERAAKIYGQLGAADLIRKRITPGADHGFDVEATVSFLNEHL